MKENMAKLLRKLYNKFIHSVAFFPAVIGILFMALVIGMLELDEAGWGRQLNSKVQWLTLKDVETARTIVGTITAGIISLLVFTFSMVMIVMNQTASQLSNRMLDNFIGNRLQKVTLSFYVGTIIYALLLLTNLGESSGGEVPVLSIYLLIAITIFDIFLFIYFLHYITQSLRFEQLIKRLHNRAFHSFHKYLQNGQQPMKEDKGTEGTTILSLQSGYFQGFSLKSLLALAARYDITIRFLETEGTFILKGTPFLEISVNKVDHHLIKHIFLDIDFYYGQEVDKNPYYGYQHLMEIGVKALSPGINDPGTAVLALNALSDLLSLRLQQSIPSVFRDKQGVVRIITREQSFLELFELSVMPIWDYGKRDRNVQKAILRLLNQLQFLDVQQQYKALFDMVLQQVKEAMNNLMPPILPDKNSYNE
jgi:uncharacterized membrane protein